MVNEAMGIKLHRSHLNCTGYSGVQRVGCRFVAVINVADKKIPLGSYQTAVQAAVAYARAVHAKAVSMGRGLASAPTGRHGVAVARPAAPHAENESWA